MFISYRRENGANMARLIKADLDRRGIRTFLDVDDLGASHFDERLLRNIEEAPNFVLVLSPGCLERCKTDGDWLRREIAHAIATGRNVVPMFEPGFRFPDKGEMPADIGDLPRHNGVEYSHTYFTASMDRLAKFLKEDVPPPPPQSSSPQQASLSSSQLPVQSKLLGKLPEALGLGCAGAVVGWTVAHPRTRCDMHYPSLVDKDTTGFYWPNGVYFVFGNHSKGPVTLTTRVSTKRRVLKEAERTGTRTALTIPRPRDFEDRDVQTLTVENLDPGEEVVVAAGNIGPVRAKGGGYTGGTGTGAAEALAQLQDRVLSLHACGVPVQLFVLEDEVARRAALPEHRGGLIQCLLETDRWLAQTVLMSVLAERCPQEAVEVVRQVATLPSAEENVRLTAVAALKAGGSTSWRYLLPKVVPAIRQECYAWELHGIVDIPQDPAELKQLRDILEHGDVSETMANLLMARAVGYHDQRWMVHEFIIPLLVSWKKQKSLVASRLLAVEDKKFQVLGKMILAVMQSAREQRNTLLLADSIAWMFQYCSGSNPPSGRHLDELLGDMAKLLGSQSFEGAVQVAYEERRNTHYWHALVASLPAQTLRSDFWLSEIECRLGAGQLGDIYALLPAIDKLEDNDARRLLADHYAGDKLAGSPKVHLAYLQRMIRLGLKLPEAEYTRLKQSRDPNIVRAADKLR